MNQAPQSDDLRLDPLLKDVKGYSLSKLWADLTAALTVALITVPQAMAYSLLAGLPLSCGLFAAIFSSIIAALSGSSRHLIIGPNNAIALLLQIGTAEIMFTFFRDVAGAERQLITLQVLSQLALLIGLFQILVGLLKLGKLTQFVSQSVVVGYLSGVALSLLIGQLPPFLGLELPIGIQSLLGRLSYVIDNISHLHLPTALIGLGSLLLLITMKKLSPKLPAAVIMLVVAGGLVQVLGLSSYVDGNLITQWTGVEVTNISLVGDIGDLSDLIPSVGFPAFNTSVINQMLPIAFAIALLGTLETALVAKSVATSSGQRVSVNQEIFGLGLANLLASCIGAMPSSASPSRSALLQHNGGKTRFAAVFSALYVAVIVLALGPIVSRAPLTSLSAILLFTSVHIVKFKEFLLCLNATRSDRLVLIATTLSCLFFSLDVAFYIGIVISITFYLNKAAVPHLIECTFDASGRIGALRHEKNRENKQVRVINVHGELFFGAADLFRSALESITEDDTQTKVLILRLKNARDMDATACLALQQLDHFLRSSERYLLLCGVTHPSWEILCDSGTIQHLGRENVFILDELHPHESLQHALIRANELIHAEEPTELEEEKRLADHKIDTPVPVKD